MNKPDRGPAAAEPAGRDRAPRQSSTETTAPRHAEPTAPRHGEPTHWSLEREASQPVGADQGGDPELAAAAGLDTNRPAPPRPPVQGPVDPALAAPPQHQYPGQQQVGGLDEPTQLHSYSAPQPPAPQQPTGAFDEPTQLHNPVQQQPMPHDTGRFPEPAPVQQPPRRAPEQVGDGVYRRNRPGLGIIVVVVTIAMFALVAFMLVNSIVTADGALDPSAVVSGVLALAGLPLTAWGLFPLLGMGPNTGPDDPRVLLRPPYALLITGLVLLLAAGLAA